MINKYIVYGLVFALVVSAGSYVLRKATEKEQTQATTVTVAAGGIANISSAQTAPVDKKLGIGIYTEYNFKDEGITVGLSYQF